MSRRFFVEPGTLAGDRIEIEGPLAHRLARVLRLRAGDEVSLFDGGGDEARIRLHGVGERRVTATVVARDASQPEPHVRVRLHQCITKGERFEWLLEKGTEVGVASFIPLIAARSVVKTPDGGNRADRWRRIVVEAAEQCGRGAVPAVEPPRRFDEAVAAAPGVVLLPYESAGEMASNIQAALDREIDAVFALGEVSLFIGPEGGFEPAEVGRAEAAGAMIVTMGSRVLRSETAGLVAATLVLHAAGALG